MGEENLRVLGHKLQPLWCVHRHSSSRVHLIEAEVWVEIYSQLEFILQLYTALNSPAYASNVTPERPQDSMVYSLHMDATPLGGGGGIERNDRPAAHLQQ